MPACVHAELAHLHARGTADAAAALEFARRLPELPAAGRGDAALRAAARRVGGIVLTADRALAARLRADGLPVLVPRARRTLLLRRPRPGNSSRGNG